MGAYVRAYLKRPAAGIFSSAMILLALPAEAHHPGGGGNTGSGGPINTISADTLAEGMMAASIRYEFIRLGQLSDADLLSVLQKMIKQRREAVELYDKGGRAELAAQEREEIDIISGYLPKQMSEADVKAAISAAIAETGAAGIKDMGKVIGALKAKYAGQMDFGKASGMVKAALTG